MQIVKDLWGWGRRWSILPARQSRRGGGGGYGFGGGESAELSQREELARTDREPHGLDFPAQTTATGHYLGDDANMHVVVVSF